MIPLDAVYHSALHFISNDSYNTHHGTLYQNVGWSFLTVRGQQHWFLSIFKALSQLLSPYLSSLLTMKSQNIGTHSQNWLLGHIPFVRTELGKTSFSHNAPHGTLSPISTAVQNPCLKPGSWLFDCVNFSYLFPNIFLCKLSFFFAVFVVLYTTSIARLMVVSTSWTLYPILLQKIQQKSIITLIWDQHGILKSCSFTEKSVSAKSVVQFPDWYIILLNIDWIWHYFYVNIFKLCFKLNNIEYINSKYLNHLI